MGSYTNRVKTGTSANEFLELYKNGKRDFSNLLVRGGRFEICDENAISKPIVLEKIKCMNTVFDNIIFNNVRIRNSNLSGSTFEDPNFLFSYLENVEACVLTINGGRMYCTNINGLDLQHSNISGLEIELCTVKGNGLTFGHMDISGIKFADEILTNSGLGNIKIEGGTKMSEKQLQLFRTLNVDVGTPITIPHNELLAIKRSKVRNQFNYS